MMEKIRNFAIIAHIDHGKSTLADRFLEITQTISKSKLVPQYLDQLSLEREKGITIKMQPVQMLYDNYILNLIDTPGHVDFSYEVSRALACVEGVILLVDGTQGIQAQTIANLELAKEQKLTIIPAINKIDLEISNLDELIDELKILTGTDEVFLVSGKSGTGVEELLRAVILKIPSPISRIDAEEHRQETRKYAEDIEIKAAEERGKFTQKDAENGSPHNAALLGFNSDNISGSNSGRYLIHVNPRNKSPRSSAALIFDSHFDSYKGIIAHVRVFAGIFKKFDNVYLRRAKYKFKILETGVFKPELLEKENLGEGMIGYIATGIKDPGILKIGETITFDLDTEPLAGYREPIPTIFASIFPSEEINYENFVQTLNKFRLNDPSIFLEPITNPLLGRGFNLGCLGLLHLEIVEQRLKREFNTEIIMTLPSVKYLVKLKNKQEIFIHNPDDLPTEDKILEIQEPIARVEIFTPSKFLEKISALIKNSRGEIINIITEKSIIKIVCSLPLNELIAGFYDDLKSISSGYASLRWEFANYQKSDLIKVDILIAEEKESSLSRIVPREKAEKMSREILLKLKELLPRQEFPIKLQASINKRIIARETVPAIYRDLAGWLYGGDRTRKMKIWQKQKSGKKKLQQIFKGKVKVPNNILIQILKMK